MDITTLSKPIVSGNVVILPMKKPEGGKIIINGIEAKPENVVKYDARVDMMDPTTKKRCFIIEHVLGPLRMLGVTDAIVLGLDKTWNFLRPEHRFAYSLGLTPEVVVGREDGKQRPKLEGIIDSVRLKTDKQFYVTVAQEVYFKTVDIFGHKGEITIAPLPPESGIVLNIELFKNSIEDIRLGENGLEDKHLAKKILDARTPFLIGIEKEEALFHAIGDVIADTVGLGRLTDAKIDVKLNFFYHSLTVGAIKRAKIIRREVFQ